MQSSCYRNESCKGAAAGNGKAWDVAKNTHNLLTMNIKFEIEGWGLRTGDGRVMLFKCDSSGARVEILRTIQLINDDPRGRSKHFNWHETYAADCLYAHMIDNLLSPAKTSEPSVAREATVEYVSNVLAIAYRSPLKYTDWTGETTIIGSEDILEALKTQSFDDGARFRILSGLERRLEDRNLPLTSSLWGQIKEKTTSYLQELQFPARVIKTVQREIDQIGTVS
jgi:hypothetical protein